ncbi:MAG: hypothetical protein RSF87_08995, partial [Cellulosilyticaceae bacterium]
MIATKVMRQEDKHVLKMIDRLVEIAINTHYTKVLSIEQIEPCLEFFDEYVRNYQQVKQEGILFKEVRAYSGEEVEPLINHLRLSYMQANGYLDKMHEACKLYRQGKYLAIYGLINNAMSYQKIAKHCIEENEKMYSYSERMLPEEYQYKINRYTADFHRQIAREQDIPLP